MDVSGEIAEDFLLPPDIAVEVVSPGQSITKLRERSRWYVANGVQIALLVVPRRRLVYRYDARMHEQTLTHTNQIDLGAVLPGLVAPVETLFAALRMV